jgi:hypothetical protein
VLGHISPQFIDPYRLAGEHLGYDRLHRRPAERRFTGQHLVRYRSEGEEIGASIDASLAHRLLGAHILRCAEGDARLRKPGPATRLAHGEGNAKIGHKRSPILEQDVFRLDVAMHDPPRMRVGQGTRHFSRKPQRIGHRKLPLAIQARPQRFAVHERHYVKDAPVRLAGIE